MVRSIIRMLIPLKKQSEALEILGSTIEETLFDPGCISYRLYRGVEDVRAIMFEELWVSDEDVQRHLRGRRNIARFFWWSKWLKNPRRSGSTQSITRRAWKGSNRL